MLETIDFRSAHMPQFEAEVLQEFENQLKEEIKLTDSYRIFTGNYFFIENNRVIEIELNGANVKQIPKSIINLRKLKELSLFRTNIERLPEIIEDLHNLKLFRIEYH